MIPAGIAMIPMQIFGSLSISGGATKLAIMPMTSMADRVTATAQALAAAFRAPIASMLLFRIVLRAEVIGIINELPPEPWTSCVAICGGAESCTSARAARHLCMRVVRK